MINYNTQTPYRGAVTIQLPPWASICQYASKGIDFPTFHERLKTWTFMCVCACVHVLYVCAYVYFFQKHIHIYFSFLKAIKYMFNKIMWGQKCNI